MTRKLFVYFMILFILSVPLLALTGSIGNPRVVLRPNITEGHTKTIDRTILIENVNDVPVHIDVYVQEGFEDVATIADEDKGFDLQPGANRKAKFSLTISDPYSHVGSILVRFSPNDGAGPSVMLGSKILIVGTKQNPEPLPEEQQAEIEDEISTDNETTAENASETEQPKQDNQNSEDQPSVSFGIKKQAPIEKTSINKDASKKPSAVIGIALLLFIVVIGIILFILLSPRRISETAAPKRAKQRKKTRGAKKK